MCLVFQGGLIAVHVLVTDPELFQGVVLSAPMLEADPEAASPILVGRPSVWFQARTLPALTIY